MEKKAFVFDTNFIIQYKKLDEVVQNLSDEYSVYITQVSINERIACVCRDIKEQYDNIEKCKEECEDFAQISITKSYDDKCKDIEKGMQNKYENLFGERIIPFQESENYLHNVIERANNKIPPFSKDKNASDKGFKDCLLWLSIINYFKDNGENEIVFISNDKSAFSDKDGFLAKEFETETGKKIQFENNSFYNTILKNEDAISEDNRYIEIEGNLQLLREEIDTKINSLCELKCVDEYGYYEFEQTFISSVEFDSEYVKNIFSELSLNINNHIFDRSVFASEILDFDGRIINENIKIPIENFESVLMVYRKILEKYPEFEKQFYRTAANILNRNYKSLSLENDEELPF